MKFEFDVKIPTRKLSDDELAVNKLMTVPHKTVVIHYDDKKKAQAGQTRMNKYLAEKGFEKKVHYEFKRIESDVYVRNLTRDK